MPQIKGVVQGAMVLKVIISRSAFEFVSILSTLQDSIIENMTLDDFKTAIFPKVKGSWNLHNQIPDLGFFIMLSSVCGIIGNKGQANYAAGGAFQDALCHYRRARGLPAVTIDLGQVSSVGYVAESGNKIVSLERIGVRPLDTAKIHRLLETCISTTTPAQIITGINTGPGSHWDEQTWAKDARFASLKYRKVETVDVITQSSGTDSILATLATTTSAEESQAVLGKALTTKLASMFMVSVDSIAPTQRLNELGVDSLVAVELKNWLASSVGCEISIFELTNNTSLKELVATLVGKWR